jgi:hypothetical protein
VAAAVILIVRLKVGRALVVEADEARGAVDAGRHDLEERWLRQQRGQLVQYRIDPRLAQLDPRRLTGRRPEARPIVDMDRAPQLGLRERLPMAATVPPEVAFRM